MATKVNDRIGSEAEAVLETHSLSKRYGEIVAVDDLSLRIPAAAVFGLLGPNGSGKTTTISMLLGLVKPSGGSFSFFGQEVKAPPRDFLRRIGAIVEMPAFYPYLSGRDNLLYFQGVSHRGRPSDVDKLLALVELSDRAHSPYQTYSLGMKQRLGIAYSLLGDPDLVFLDEPTNGLDPGGVVEVRGLIKQLSTAGRTIVLSSHLLHEVEQVCENVAIIDHGRLISQGRVGELLRRPDTIRLMTTDQDRALLVLQSLDWITSIEPDGGCLNVEVPSARLAEVTKALASLRVYVTRMEPVETSLEDFFLEVTRSPLDETVELTS